MIFDYFFTLIPINIPTFNLSTLPYFSLNTAASPCCTCNVSSPTHNLTFVHRMGGRCRGFLFDFTLRVPLIGSLTHCSLTSSQLLSEAHNKCTCDKELEKIALPLLLFVIQKRYKWERHKASNEFLRIRCFICLTVTVSHDRDRGWDS